MLQKQAGSIAHQLAKIQLGQPFWVWLFLLRTFPTMFSKPPNMTNEERHGSAIGTNCGGLGRLSASESIVGNFNLSVRHFIEGKFKCQVEYMMQN